MDEFEKIECRHDTAKEMCVSENDTRWLSKYGIDPQNSFIIANKRRISIKAWEQIKSLEYSRNF